MHPENRDVGKKLGIATGFMFTLPIAAYFIALHVFHNKLHPDNWAAAAAIIVTNVIVGTYCYQAYIEDEDEKSNTPQDDADGPRVGIYKHRTD
jgi:hypothetical protein